MVTYLWEILYVTIFAVCIEIFNYIYIYIYILPKKFCSGWREGKEKNKANW